jgi:hypothetical protein
MARAGKLLSLSLLICCVLSGADSFFVARLHFGSEQDESDWWRMEGDF